MQLDLCRAAAPDGSAPRPFWRTGSRPDQRFALERCLFCGSYRAGSAQLIGARLLLGVGEAPTFPANAKAIGYWFPRQERSFATSFLMRRLSSLPGSAFR